MRYLTSLTTILVVLVVVSLAFPRPAYAYLDPGTGSYILQLLIAGLLGVAFAMKMFWNDIKTFFRNLLAGKDESEEAQD